MSVRNEQAKYFLSKDEINQELKQSQLDYFYSSSILSFFDFIVTSFVLILLKLLVQLLVHFSSFVRSKFPLWKSHSE